MESFIRNKNTLSGSLQDELVMMDLDRGKYFSLNPVATRIWTLLENPLTIDELCRILTDEYNVDIEQCRAEVREHLTEMTGAGLILRIEQ